MQIEDFKRILFYSLIVIVILLVYFQSRQSNAKFFENKKLTANINHVKTKTTFIINSTTKTATATTTAKSKGIYNGKYKPEKSKYIIYECKSICGGWGDRLKGILAGYFWAILTNRTFLINIQKPCDLRNMMDSNTVKWDENVDEILRGNNGLSRHHIYSIDGREFKNNLNKLNLFEYYKDVNIISFENNWDWLYDMNKNILLQERIKELGIRQDDFKTSMQMHSVYNSLFKLKPHLQETYEQFLRKAKPNSTTKLICVQVRIGGARPNVGDDWTFMPRNKTLLFWQFVRTKLLPLYKNKNYKIFITTDTESVEKECIEQFGASNVVTIPGVFAHIDKEAYQNRNDCSRVQKVILDFHALQNCDEAVITRSGFGRLGVMNRLDKNNFTIHMYDFDTLDIRDSNISDFNDLTK